MAPPAKRSAPATAARRAPATTPSRRGAPRPRGGWTPWLYLAPALAVLGALLVYPVYQLGLISFLEYTQAQVSGGEPTRFRGLANYTDLFADDQFGQVLLATVGFAAACVLGTLAVGCALAVLLTRVRALPGSRCCWPRWVRGRHRRSPAPPSGCSSSTPTSAR